jgi:hypothetical protein
MNNRNIKNILLEILIGLGRGGGGLLGVQFERSYFTKV